jgi:hypothetical protein
MKRDPRERPDASWKRSGNERDIMLGVWFASSDSSCTALEALFQLPLTLRSSRSLRSPVLQGARQFSHATSHSLAIA